MQKRAFTLIELLVVIAIIALLVSILLPSLKRAKALAMRVVCASNERNIISACHLYASDQDDFLPLSYWQTDVVQVKIDGKGVLYGMGLLFKAGIISPDNVEASVFCPSYLKNEVEGGTIHPLHVGLAALHAVGRNSWQGEARSSYVMRTCGKSSTDALRLAKASVYSPILLADLYTKKKPEHVYQTHDGDGYNMADFSGGTQWVDLNEFDWVASTPSWHIDHTWIFASSNHQQHYNFWNWSREMFGYGH